MYLTSRFGGHKLFFFGCKTHCTVVGLLFFQFNIVRQFAGSCSVAGVWPGSRSADSGEPRPATATALGPVHFWFGLPFPAICMYCVVMYLYCTGSSKRIAHSKICCSMVNEHPSPHTPTTHTPTHTHDTHVHTQPHSCMVCEVHFSKTLLCAACA